MAAEKPTSRRDFLRGRAVARTVLSAVDQFTGSAGSMLTRLASTARCQATRGLMACDFVIEYHAADGPRAADAALAALDLVEELEEQLSIYRPYSELSLLNETAASGAVLVEPRLYDLLALCRELHAETQGAFDVTGGPLSRAWGFVERQGRLPDEAERIAALAAVGFVNIELDANNRSVRFRRAGVEINLGAIGKGYALDRAAEVLEQRGVGDFLCHGGRSSVLARGASRGSGEEGWLVALPHPLRPEENLGEFLLGDQALGTTGSGVQFFEAEGRRFGHVLDPLTGWPAEGVLTATVVSPTAAEADALSTALYVLGPGGAAEFCQTHPAIGAVLACPRAGDASAVDVHAFNLAAMRWRPAVAG